ncbi:ParA family protein [Iningainema tapete]|uniref:ParA family protein n=1 Tax=Iningainema tapete BLCC-T55 TaxID=2748662 RepID=A0A8J7C060_9CYAN|nr:AAA family ATPase [Iningainema tapete]MBD2777408.1 ParA family protein [Iningainema tapete BLCC-T55]
MIILCTHNSGGVGKTTLAIHAAGVLSSQSGRTTLLIDCDDQADSWQFYANRMPNQYELLKVGDSLSILDNQKRQKITNIVNLEEYDHIVIDIDSEFLNTIHAIIYNQPDVVLIPVNKSQRRKALNKLPIVLSAVALLESKYGYSFEVIIVPLGVKQDVVLEALKQVQDKPQSCRVALAIRDLQDEMSLAVYEDRKYIWDYTGCEDLYQDFCSILEI